MHVCTALLWQREAGTNTRKARKRSVKIQNKTPTRSQTDPCVRGISPAQHKPAAEEAEAPNKTFFYRLLSLLCFNQEASWWKNPGHFSL